MSWTSRTSGVAVITVVSVLGTNSVAISHTGDRIVPIYEMPTSGLPNLHDATLADWEAAIPISFDHRDLRYPSRMEGQPTDTDDLAMRAYLGWNHANQRLYAGFEFIDDFAYKLESLKVMVDGDHSGGAYESQPTTLEERAWAGQAQRYSLYLHASEGTDPVFRGGPLLSWAYDTPWLEVGVDQVGEEPALTTVEMLLTPWDAMGDGSTESRRSLLEPDRVLGLQIAFPDFDPDLEAVFVLGEASAGVGGYDESADQFVDAILIPCDIADCSRAAEPPSAVRADSWGRIKASLR